MRQRTNASAIRTVARAIGVSALVAGTTFAAVAQAGAVQHEEDRRPRGEGCQGTQGRLQR